MDDFNDSKIPLRLDTSNEKLLTVSLVEKVSPAKNVEIATVYDVMN